MTRVQSPESATDAAALRDFVENITAPLHWVGPDGIIIWANQAELDLLGYSREEYIGHHIAEFHVERALIDDILTRLTRSETLCEYASQLRHKDGSVRDVLINSSVYRQHGEFVHTRCLTIDVTSRRRAERTLGAQYAVTRVLMECETLEDAGPRILDAVGTLCGCAAGAIWSVDDLANRLRCVQTWGAEGVDAAAFDAATRAMTFAPGAGLPGRVWVSGKPTWIEDVAGDVNFPRRTAAEQARLHGAFALPIVTRERVSGVFEFFSDRPRVPDADMLRLFEAVGAQLGAFMERQYTSQSRARLVRALEDANRVKDEFLATLSHELRTPLNAVLGYTRMLRTGHIGADGQERAVDIIERNANVLAQLVADVLDVSSIVTGKVTLNMGECDVMSLVHAAVDIVRPAAEAKDIAMRVDGINEAVTLHCDAARIQQVLWNVLTNAVKFTPRGGAVGVGIAIDAGAVRITVADTGIGIRAELLPYIFQRFWQGDATVTRQMGGLGLGLALARHFVELHGGTITAESKGEGHGSTFTVTLPIIN